MRSTTDTSKAESRAPQVPSQRRAATWSIASLLVLSSALGCASTAKTKSEADQAPTIEHLLTAPLTGVEGRNSIRSAMMKLYGIASSDSKRIDNQPKTLQDRHVLSMFWLEPAPADFMSMAVAAEPCFPTARALQLTQAEPHTKGRTPGAQTYDAVRNGVMVSFSTTSDKKCVSYIHIEPDR